MDAFDEWMAEHRFLEHLLEALEQCAEAAQAMAPHAISDLAAFADVLSEVDRTWHQAAEEQLLLPAMRAHGVPDEGLLGAVSKEHEEARALVKSLGDGARADVPAEQLAELAYSYADHARCHIYTEETMLFPAARAKLPAAAMQELNWRLHAFVVERGDQQIESLRASATGLASRYATSPACIDPRVSWRGTDD
jgi:hemerythrin-like domain-containing protein